jgi:two-component system nitrate/nitrite response regulator NarL
VPRCSTEFGPECRIWGLLCRKKILAQTGRPDILDRGSVSYTQNSPTSVERHPAGPTHVISVLIVADIRLYRDGLADALARREALHVAGTAASREDAIAFLDTSHPDVVLVDMAMLDGHATAQALLEHMPDTRVVALAVPELERDVLSCAELGVAGLVPRDASLDELVATLECAARGEVRCSPRMAAAILRRLAKLATEHGAARLDVLLTSRESEIIELIDRGLSNKEIARRLGIEVATVKNHVHNILEKLQVHRRSEAAAWARGRSRRRTLPISGPIPS